MMTPKECAQAWKAVCGIYKDTIEKNRPNKTMGEIVRSLGKEYYVKAADGYDVSLFWHEPSLNLGWYPILQVDTDEKTVFWGEGTENPDYWYDLAVRAIEKLC